MSGDAVAYIAELERRGQAGDSEDQLYRRLHAAVEDARPADSDLDLADWTSTMVRKARAAIRTELCDEKGRCLKQQYSSLLDVGLGSQQAKAIAGTVTGILAHVNPALAVPPVIAFASLWVARVGLNKWCAVVADDVNR